MHARPLHSNRALSLLGWYALGASLALAYTRLGQANLPPQALFNSDMFYLPALYLDIMRGGAVSAWRLTPAPYFFPDMPLYFGLHAITGGPRAALVVYGVVQVITLVVLVQRIATRLVDSDIVRPLVLLGGAGLVLAVTARYVPYTFALLQPTTHFSVVLAAAAGLLIVLDALVAPSPGYRAPLLTALTVLAVASDILFIVQFVAPTVAALALLAVAGYRDRRRLLLLAGGMALGTAAGLYGGLALLHNTAVESYISFGWENALRGSEELHAWLASEVRAGPGALIVSAMAIALCALLAVGQVRRAQGVRYEQLFALAYLPAAAGINVLFVIAAGRADFMRYIILPVVAGLLAWPMLMGAATSRVAGMRRAAANAAIALALGGVLLASALQVSAGAIHGLLWDTPPLVHCLDEQAAARGLRHGISNYWQAKYISVLSRQGLHVVQVQPDLTPFHWINSIEWYDRDFEFIIIDEASEGWHLLSQELIVSRFGEPADTFRCGASLALVYDTPVFSGQFRDDLLLGAR